VLPSAECTLIRPLLHHPAAVQFLIHSTFALVNIYIMHRYIILCRYNISALHCKYCNAARYLIMRLADLVFPLTFCCCMCSGAVSQCCSVVLSFRSQLSCHHALEVCYENALYKFTFDIDVDIDTHVDFMMSSCFPVQRMGYFSAHGEKSLYIRRSIFSRWQCCTYSMIGYCHDTVACLSVRSLRCTLWQFVALSVTYGVESCTVVFLGGHYRFTFSYTFATVYHLLFSRKTQRTAFPLRKFFKESLTHGPLNLCVNEKTVRVSDSPYFKFQSHTVPPPISIKIINHNAAGLSFITQFMLCELHWMPRPVVT